MIDVKFDKKAFKKYINNIAKFEKTFYTTYVKAFLDLTFEFITIDSDYYVRAKYGDYIASEVANSWKKTIIGDSMTITNPNVFIEFGVGVTGGSAPHPKADITGYVYNYPSEWKQTFTINGNQLDNAWMFFKNDVSTLDIPKSDAYINTLEDGRSIVITQGTVGAEFFYNAILDYLSYGYKTCVDSAIKVAFK